MVVGVVDIVAIPVAPCLPGPDQDHHLQGAAAIVPTMISMPSVGVAAAATVLTMLLRGAGLQAATALMGTDEIIGSNHGPDSWCKEGGGTERITKGGRWSLGKRRKRYNEHPIPIYTVHWVC